MRAYLDILGEILENGEYKGNRTSVKTIWIPGVKFEHDMSEGFPLLTTKKIKYENVSSELEWFINGRTDKRWLQDRGNPIWNSWCTPIKVPYGNDEETKEAMARERDLGPVYGFQWRHFGADYEGYDKDYEGKGVDQLANAIDALKEDPENRRILVSAWNPVDIPKMALPPCHYSFHLMSDANGKLNLSWDQRSCDTPVGIPFNIASYATLLELIALEVGMRPNKLIGFLEDVHIYENQIDKVKEQLSREPTRLPILQTKNFTSIFDWKSSDSQVVDYHPQPFIKYELAI